MFRVILAAALLSGSAAAASAQAPTIIDVLTGGSSFWQGSWGTEGTTPVVTVARGGVSYRGSNYIDLQVSGVGITATTLRFQVAGAEVTLKRVADNRVEMVSTIAGHSSQPILLCRSQSPACP
jgi:hypothetical protein